MYFGYDEGIDPSLLRLGAMVLDYANPRQRFPYLHREAPELFEPPPRAIADKRPYCVMAQARSSTPAASFGLEPLLMFTSQNSKLSARCVVGRNGSKVEIVDPHSFFKDMIEEEGARLWLRVALTVTHRYQKWWKNAFNSPKIWLCTGVYLIEDARVIRSLGKLNSNELSSGIAIADPTGIAAMLGAEVHGRIKLENGFEVYAETQILGRKVWAAQWQQVGSVYYTKQQSAWDPTAGGAAMKLLNSWSVDTERGQDQELQIAEVSLGNRSFTEGSITERTEGPSQSDESDLLAEFDDELQELMEEIIA